MKTKKVKSKNTIINIIIFVIGLVIGSILTLCIINIQDKKNENNKITESPYTINEIYEIIESPNQFYELNDYHYNDFNYVITHFYDYFSKNTDFLVATKVEEKDGKVTKVLSTKKIAYKDYIYLMSDFYHLEEQKEETCKKNTENKEYTLTYEDCLHNLDYKNEATILVYGNAEGFFNEITDKEWEKSAQDNSNIHLD